MQALLDALSFMDQAHDHLTGFLLPVDYEIPGVLQEFPGYEQKRPGL